MAREKEKEKEKEKKNEQEFKPYKLELLIQTPYIAPFLSPVKMMKKAQISRILECYKKQGATDEDLEVLSHIDRAFERDAECNAFIPGSVLSGAIRQALNNRSIVVKGMIKIPKDAIIVAAKNVDAGGARTPMFYEYVAAGTTLSGIVAMNIQLPQNLKVSIGAYKHKGYGNVVINATQVNATIEL